MAITIYAWDFFGPRSEGTARHFLRHLEEFWQKSGLVGCEAGVESAGTGHHAVWCKAPESTDEAILSLRPHRSSRVPPIVPP